MLRNLLNTKLPLDSPNQTFRIYLNRINFVLETFYCLVLIFTCISAFTLIVKEKSITQTVLNTYLLLYLVINIQIKKFLKKRKKSKSYKEPEYLPLDDIQTDTNDYEESTEQLAFTLQEKLISKEDKTIQGVFNPIESNVDRVKNEETVVIWEEEEFPVLEIKENLIEKIEIFFYTRQNNNDKDVLDFKLIEKKIEKIQDEIKQDNVVFLNTIVTINKPNKFIEIEIYTQERDKMFKYRKIIEFNDLSNQPTIEFNDIPNDIKAALKRDGTVTIQLNLDKEV